VLSREARDQVRALTGSDREQFGGSDVTLGDRVVFTAASLVDSAVRGRVALCAAYWSAPLPAPPDGARCFAPWPRVEREVHARVGYPIVGGLAIRADVVELLVDRLRHAATSQPFDPPADLCAMIGATGAPVHAILRDLGYRDAGGGRYAKRRFRRRRKIAAERRD
jgi:ATP-dependent RNA helicase SUPV3L1/SUV3